MTEENKIYDCSRGCTTQRTEQGELICTYNPGCCKLKDFDWLQDIHDINTNNLFEVRFKNTRKDFFENNSGQLLKIGDLVVVEATTDHDLGIITLQGPMVARQIQRNHYDLKGKNFKKIYRKARALDLEKWQEAIAKENSTMIRARQIAAELGLNMKIGDVEYQGDGSKAIFYYIADERVDFRQLIKVFAEEFRIRIEMKQIGARQEAGLIGGVGVCGRELCCSKYISNFQSISTQAARCQDLSLNPQKLAGQCSKLKCCLNYEVPVYVDAHKHIPHLHGPLEFLDGQAFLVKTDVLKGIMWFSYEEHSLAKIAPLTAEEVAKIKAANAKGIKPATLFKENEKAEVSEFVTAEETDSIDRFDKKKKNKKKRTEHGSKKHSAGNHHDKKRHSSNSNEDHQ